MTVAADYFARVRPLLGAGLSARAIAVDDAELALPVIELLASCMLGRVHVTRPETRAALDRHAAWKQPFAPLEDAPAAAVDARIFARRTRTGEPASATWSVGAVAIAVDPTDVFAWHEVGSHVARTLRDVLLGSMPWPAGTWWYGDPAWPFSPRPAPFVPGAIDLAALRGRHVMVVGCGSLGSEAIRLLAGHGARWTLVDDAQVTVWNLARQWFGAAEVGRAKVEALAARLAPVAVRTWRTQLATAELPALEALLRDDPPDVLILATGTHHHGMLGELAWRLGIPHVAACCYPQARYFEVSVVSPRERTPCLHCFRGNLYRGSPEPPPITDEVASFLYRPMDDAARARAYTDLVAEPATLIETQRAAGVLARCAAELCVPDRSPWFRRLLAEDTTCLLGGNVAREVAPGDYAYGIRAPGQVIRLGTQDVAGPAASVHCDVCARTLAVTLREALPAITDADADAALV